MAAGEGLGRGGRGGHHGGPACCCLLCPPELQLRFALGCIHMTAGGLGPWPLGAFWLPTVRCAQPSSACVYRGPSRSASPDPGPGHAESHVPPSWALPGAAPGWRDLATVYPLAVASQVLSGGASLSPSFMSAGQGADPYCLARQGPSSWGCVGLLPAGDPVAFRALGAQGQELSASH